MGSLSPSLFPVPVPTTPFPPPHRASTITGSAASSMGQQGGMPDALHGAGARTPAGIVAADLQRRTARLASEQLSAGVQLDPYKTHKLLVSGALAGAISRTLTAPVDRLKMILQVQDDSIRGMTLRQGMQRMAAEGSWTTYFKGNGANVLKIAPETAMKLTLNDVFKKMVCPSDTDYISAGARMAVGGIAGAVAQFITYPLDTIRTRLAVSTHGTYQGIMHAAMLMRASEGLGGFYRGLVPSMIGILPYAGVDIALFEMFKQHLLDEAEASGGPAPHLSLLAAGMLSSSIAQVVSYPLALIRTRLQAQGMPGAPLKYNGMSDVLRKTLQREGVRGLYKGLLPNIFKLAPAAGISWYVFEETKQALGLDPRV